MPSDIEIIDRLRSEIATLSRDLNAVWDELIETREKMQLDANRYGLIEAVAFSGYLGGKVVAS